MPKEANVPVIQVPMPERLEPKSTSRTLMMNVRNYFYSLYNAANGNFKKLLQSVGNKDSLTGNRLFDRHEAVGMIKDLAKETKDASTASAKDGDIYRCLVNLMRQNDMGLKLRRREYNRLSHQTPAE